MNAFPVRIGLRVLGVFLLAFAAVHFVIDLSSSLLVETHSAANGSSSIMTVFAVRYVTWLSGIAGIVLFTLSFIRRRQPV